MRSMLVETSAAFVLWLPLGPMPASTFELYFPVEPKAFAFFEEEAVEALAFCFIDHHGLPLNFSPNL